MQQTVTVGSPKEVGFQIDRLAKIAALEAVLSSDLSNIAGGRYDNLEDLYDDLWDLTEDEFDGVVWVELLNDYDAEGLIDKVTDLKGYFYNAMTASLNSVGIEVSSPNLHLRLPEIDRVELIEQNGDNIAFDLHIEGRRFRVTYEVRRNRFWLSVLKMQAQGYDYNAIKQGLEDRSLWP